MLIFARILADDQFHILRIAKRHEMPTEFFVQTFQRREQLPGPKRAAKPMFAGRKFLQPIIRGGDGQQTIVNQQAVNPAKKRTGFRQAIDEVCGEDEIEAAEPLVKLHGVTLVENDPLGCRRKIQVAKVHLAVCDQFPLLENLIGEFAALLKVARDLDETRRKVDTDHLVTMFGQLKTGASHRTSQLKGASPSASRSFLQT